MTTSVRAPELHCPACARPEPLSRLDSRLPAGVRLYRCLYCQGVVANREAVRTARAHHHNSHPLLVERVVRHRCRACQALARPYQTDCDNCGKSMKLACPGCSGSMTLLSVTAVVIDVCFACELAFFDQGEFLHACNQSSAFGRAMRAPARETSSPYRELVGDAFAYSPVESVDLTVSAAGAAGDAVLGAAEGFAGAVSPGAAGASALEAGEAVADVSSAVAEGVLEILGSVFDGV